MPLPPQGRLGEGQGACQAQPPFSELTPPVLCTPFPAETVGQTNTRSPRNRAGCEESLQSSVRMAVPGAGERGQAAREGTGLPALGTVSEWLHGSAQARVLRALLPRGACQSQEFLWLDLTLILLDGGKTTRQSNLKTHSCWESRAYNMASE